MPQGAEAHWTAATGVCGADWTLSHWEQGGGGLWHMEQQTDRLGTCHGSVPVIALQEIWQHSWAFSSCSVKEEEGWRVIIPCKLWWAWLRKTEMQPLLSLINLHTALRTQVFVKQQNKGSMMGFINFQVPQRAIGDFWGSWGLSDVAFYHTRKHASQRQ